METRPDDVAALVAELDRQREELHRFRQIIENINRGVRLEEILGFVYDEFRNLIPYNRISYATLDHETGNVVARWVRSDQESLIPPDYSQPLATTRLAELLRSGQPRIINDLKAYLEGRPYSPGTRKLLKDGMRSSLTCPLIVEGRGVGFLFFDSTLPAAYSGAHVDLFRQIAGVVAVLIERGRVFSELAEKSALVEQQSELLRRERDRQSRELELARKVQRSLIPTSLPRCSTLSMAMLYEPAAEVGGDLLDCIPLGECGALVYVADAMGHGVPAALVMSVVRTAFHGALGRQRDKLQPSPAALLAEVNGTLVELFGQHLVTAVCARLDRETRTVTLSLAGHPPALLKHGKTSEVVSVPARSIPLGLKAATDFIQTSFPFDIGDTLLLYTDGVIEATNPSESLYGLGQLKTMLQAWRSESPEALVTEIRREIEKHTGSLALEDDLTILALQVATPG